MNEQQSRILVWLSAVFLITSLGQYSNSVAGGERGINQGKFKYKRVFKDLKFNQPTTLLQEPGNGEHWYILEKGGKIYYFSNVTRTSKKHLYADISGRVDHSFEGGLLGMAFDPGFKENGYVYLSYTSSDEPLKDDSKSLYSRISRFKVNKKNTRIIPDSEVILLTITQPWNNHNGGNIMFGPDGFLYAGYGDGGSWGDPKNNAQNVHTLLGTMLRIDVNVDAKDIAMGVKYKIPKDNPFASSKGCSKGSGCPEIYAWGLRNPWRWSFDRVNGKLWAGDVGQGAWEEIDLIEKGGNYGWRCYEGSAKYNVKDCKKAKQYVMPVVDYSHLPSPKSHDGMGASVTGGFVYRGKAIPELKGVYIYADFVHGLIWGLKEPYGKSPKVELLFDTDIFIVTFAETNDGELYFLNYQGDGGIYKFVPAE